jgi:hypothetical protein
VSAVAAEPHRMPSVFQSPEKFFVQALEELHERAGHRGAYSLKIDAKNRFLELAVPDDLARRYRKLPPEVRPKDKLLRLTADRELMQKAIRAARSDVNPWPELDYLWELHPAVTWARDRMRALFGRHEAPILEVPALARDERVLVVSGVVPNRRGQPVVHRWYGAVFKGQKLERLEPFEELLKRTELGVRPLPNTRRKGAAEDLQPLVPLAVRKVREKVLADRAAEEKRRSERLEEMRAKLKELRQRKEAQLELDFAQSRNKKERDEQRRGVQRTFEDFEVWVHETLTTEAQPFLQVIAALQGGAK